MMTKKNSTSFHKFYYDDENVSPAERAKIDFEVELIGKLIEAREASALCHLNNYKITG